MKTRDEFTLPLAEISPQAWYRIAVVAADDEGRRAQILAPQVRQPRAVLQLPVGLGRHLAEQPSLHPQTVPRGVSGSP